MAFDNSFNNFNNGNDAVNYNNGTDIVDANIRQIASGKPSTQNSEKGLEIVLAEVRLKLSFFCF